MNVVPRVRASALAMASLLAISACDDRQAFRRPDLTWSRMLTQPRANAYDPSRAFANGMAMRTPPAGAIPHGETAVEAPPTTLALMEVGRRRFDVACAPCHGVTGDGQTVVAHKMQHRRPPPLDDARSRALPREHVFDVITRGYGMMPSYDTMLTEEERWAVADYVRALQLSRYAPVGSLPPDVRADLERHAR